LKTKLKVSVGKQMKTTQLLATLIAATLPLGTIVAEDSGKTETTEQKQEQQSDATGMKGMMAKGQMMCNCKDQDAELDKLIEQMNSTAPDKKLDAMAAVVTKLVEQRKTMHEQMQKMMSTDQKEGMGMCRMMMGMSTQ
jgi:O-methyltransferase involved in polyketide biosynthesis